LREDIGRAPNELIYSLRSVEQYFPHRKVWFVCGQPTGLTPDARLVHHQEGSNKWERVRSSYLKICNCNEISENFFLFNDDFFVLKRPNPEFINFVDGSLEHRVREMEKNIGYPTNYSKSLSLLTIDLHTKRLDTMNFALHVPILYNKTMIKKTIAAFPGNPMFRSAYGNFIQVPYMSHKDVKIYDMTTIPKEDWDFVSTTEESFAKGAVGEYIRKMFPDPSYFEGPKVVSSKELFTEEGDIRYG
jgi:hypothetical protein